MLRLPPPPLLTGDESADRGYLCLGGTVLEGLGLPPTSTVQVELGVSDLSSGLEFACF